VIHYPRKRLLMVKQEGPPAPDTGRRPIVWDLFLAEGEKGDSAVVGMFLTNHVDRAQVLQPNLTIGKDDYRAPNKEEIAHLTSIVLEYPQGQMHITEDDFLFGVA